MDPPGARYIPIWFAHFRAHKKLQHMLLSVQGKVQSRGCLSFIGCVCTAKHTPSFQCVHPFPEKSQAIASKSTHIRVCIQLDNTRSECSINSNLNCYTSGVTFFGSGGVLLSLEAFFGEFLICPLQNLKVICCTKYSQESIYLSNKHVLLHNPKCPWLFGWWSGIMSYNDVHCC